MKKDPYVVHTGPINYTGRPREQVALRAHRLLRTLKVLGVLAGLAVVAGLVCLLISIPSIGTAVLYGLGVMIGGVTIVAAFFYAFVAINISYNFILDALYINRKAKRLGVWDESGK